MKRTLVVLALLLAVGIALCFADDAAKPAGITFGAWGRSIYAPLASSDSDVTAAIGTSWGGAPRQGFTIQGDSEFAGFYAHIGVDANAFGITDDEAGWIKPLPGLQIKAGCAFDDTLRGQADFGSYDWIRTQWEGDDTVFNRIGGQKGGGSAPIDAIITYKMEGLFVYWCQTDAKDAADKANAGDTQLTKYGDGKDISTGALNNASFGAGYTIAGIGTIKAQRLGYAQLQAGYNEYQIGFALSSVPNLSAEAAAWLPSNKTDAGWTFKVPVYVTYKMGPTSVHVLGIYQALDNADGKNASIDAGLGVDYDIGGGLGFTGDVRYGNKYYYSGTAGTSFLVGITKGFSNGMVGIGFQYDTIAFANTLTAQTADKAQWAVPIKWEYWF
jgi:hypothetical protein